MKQRLPIVLASVAAVLVLLVSSLLVTGGRTAAAKQTRSSVAVTLPTAPKDPFVKQDKKFKGQSITYFGGSVGLDHDTDVAVAKQFTKDTGIKINIVEQPSASTDALANLQRGFGSGSSSIDASRIDVVWPGQLAQYLVDLRKPLKSLVGLEYSSLIKNDTIGGHLVGIPYQGDFGMLYYRKDLLSKYHLKVPTTWAQLTNEARKIQAGERKTTKNFVGFVFQGNAYEGLTCNALEWVASYGGGSFINGKGVVTINNPRAKAALRLAQSWVGGISPRGVTTYQESDTQNAFTSGIAAFARNWPYMDAAKLLGKVNGKVGVAPLPHGPGGKSSATVGGWQVAVSKFSKHKGAAEAWARYYASKPVQIWRAVNSSIVPTMPSVNTVPSVKNVMPFLGTVGIKTARVTRPSKGLKSKYSQGSTIIFQGINRILNGGSVDSGVSTIASQLKNLHP